MSKQSSYHSELFYAYYSEVGEKYDLPFRRIILLHTRNILRTRLDPTLDTALEHNALHISI